MSIVISEALEEPYFKCEVPLDQNPGNSAEILSSVATRLLEKVKSDVPLTESYRIEVKFDNRKKVLEFCVSLKTTAWYDVFLKGKPNAIKIAQDYITNAEKQFPPEPTKTKVNVEDEDDELDFDAFDICPQYKKKGECKCSELSSDVIHSDYNFSFCLQHKIIYCDGTFPIERPHPKFLCKHPVKRKDHSKKICGFHIPDILMIEDLSKIEDKFSEYVFAMRQDPFRMFILVPKKHMENEDLVKLTDFWKFLLPMQQKLSFHLVAFNFGTWESELRNDPYSLGCHAHANLYFNEISWNNAKNIANNPIMNICNIPGPNYLRKNCEELKIYRLNEAKCDYLLNRLVKLEAKTEIFDPLEEWYEDVMEKEVKPLMKKKDSKK